MATGLGETGEERAYYSLNARAWPLFAPFYDFVTFPFRKVRREVAALVRLDAHSRVLDVATGTGEQARAFAESPGTVIGIDLSEAMLRVARAKPPRANLTLRQGDATDLPFDGASFDVSCISFALHEMPRSIRERVAAEMARVTAPGGTILIVDYAPPRRPVEKAISGIVRLFEGHRYADFIRSDIRELMRPAGIDVRNERVCLFGTVRIVVGTRAGAPLACRENAPPVFGQGGARAARMGSEASLIPVVRHDQRSLSPMTGRRCRTRVRSCDRRGHACSVPWPASVRPR